ncbi:MAG: hypothetical protein ABSG84_15100 [Acidobacteriaceae bacterium]|jgi:photosystem II stability/assembly factor-like uncharacterized protein
MRTALILSALLITTAARAQWEIVTPPPTTADLRGIDNVGKGVVWASGSDGTVLRSEDDGYLWQRCAIPPGAEHLDFRGIQAFDANTAIVMSSGKGPLSRLYRTTDGCQTWTLLFTNPNADGSFDALKIPIWMARQYEKDLLLLGGPVGGQLIVWKVKKDEPAGELPRRRRLGRLPKARQVDVIFAASNSALSAFQVDGVFAVATGGAAGARVIEAEYGETGPYYIISRTIPVGNGSSSSGIFSLVFAMKPLVPANAREPWLAHIVRGKKSWPPPEHWMVSNHHVVAVGGDSLAPDSSASTAAFSLDTGRHWLASQTQPHGFRSAVAYDATTKTWITVGPNGTDLSTDDGRNWRPLKPTASDPPDADQHWNALSLPFVVGPHGRIGRLRPDALGGMKP